MYLSGAKRLLSDINPVLESETMGCDQHEISALENLIDGELPGSFKEWMLWMGHGPTRILIGSHCFYDYWIGNSTYHNGEAINPNALAVEILEEDNIASSKIENTFAFFSHQGYKFNYIPLEKGENPPIHSYMEGEGFSELASSLDDYLSNYIIKPHCQLPKSIWASSLEELNNHHSYDRLINKVSFNILKMDHIPKKIFDFKNIELLDLRYWQIEELSPRISELKKLKTINLNSNKLKVLPTKIVELENLEKLYLLNNKWDTIPDEIYQLPNLQTLTISSDQLHDKELKQLKQDRPHLFERPND